MVAVSKYNNLLCKALHKVTPSMPSNPRRSHLVILVKEV
jgi:hypothetical protein